MIRIAKMYFFVSILLVVGTVISFAQTATQTPPVQAPPAAIETPAPVAQAPASAEQSAQTPAAPEAQNKEPGAQPLDACGERKHIKFSVHISKDQHPTPEVPADKAMVYVIQQAWKTFVRWESSSDITAFALDGKWIGANRGFSYFFFPIEPGEHHACSFAWIGRIGDAQTRTLLHSLTAEAGKTYYFVQKELPVEALAKHVSMELNLVDAETAKPLIADANLATTDIH